MEIDRNSPVTTISARNGINRYNFLGKETQVATGYIDLQARFYDPTIGRFMAVDPQTEGQDEFSPYHYSFDNPIRFSDPDGRWPGEGIFKSIKNWLNTPLTKGQQDASRGLNISFSGQDFKSQTRGDLLFTSIGQGLKHGMGHGLPGNSKTSGLPKSVLNGPAGKSGKAASPAPANPDLHPQALAKGFEIPMVGGKPDFSKYLANVGEGQNNQVQISLTGNYAKDFKAANQAAGLDKQPENTTWHHVDYDTKTGTGQMQLVERDAHKAATPHKGGAAEYRKDQGTGYR